MTTIEDHRDQPTSPMAATNHYLKPLAGRLISVIFATAPAIAIADTDLYPHQEWVCQAGSNGAWQCQDKAATPGAYPQPAKAAIKKPHSPRTSEHKVANKRLSNRHGQWDWIPKNQLDDPSLCKTGCEGAYVAPEPDWQDANLTPDIAPLRANAASTSIEGDVVTLSGDVILSQGNRRLKADSASLDRSSHELKIEGNIEVREPGVLIHASKGQINTETNLGHFEAASFLQHDNSIRGKAERIQRNSSNTLDMERGYITQCTPDDEVWVIHASEIHLDNNEGWGSAQHARLTIKDVPVFYTPYMTFPIDERRKTGFLWPTLGSSDDNGFEITTPYYLNLAPNYDATLAPHYISDRGTMTTLELRQLGSLGEWMLSGALLEDDTFTDNPPLDDPDTAQDESDGFPPREKRWVASVIQSGNFFGISTSIDYTKVGDNEYFEDLASNNLEVKRSTHLNQQLTLGFSNENWQTELTAQDHQTIDEELSDQYQLMPRFSVERNATGANFDIEWLFEAEFTDFQHDESINNGGNFITGQRTFAEAGLSFPMRSPAGFIIPTAKVRSVSYDLEEFKLGDDDSPSATTPLATLDMGLIFERDIHFSSNRYVQTLEPRLYYFYSDFEQQTNPNFDTSELTFSYSQLFRDTRFSGHDRLDDANQISAGISSRFIDDGDGREVLSLSLGQIFYFEDSRVYVTDTLVNPDGSTPGRSNSHIASEIHYQPTDKIWLSNDLLWDSRRDKLLEGGVDFHYQTDAQSLYNIGYRFRRNGSSNFRRDGDGKLVSDIQDLSQANASLVLPIGKRWSLYAHYLYDVEEHRALDDITGIQYEDCCWIVRLLYQQGLDKDIILDKDIVDVLTGNIVTKRKLVTERDYAFILEFQLKGLGSLGNKVRGILEKNILGYEDLE
ncbi:MAG: LPS-assembly protein LptD [Pseudomonadales bacterium]